MKQKHNSGPKPRSRSRGKWLDTRTARPPLCSTQEDCSPPNAGGLPPASHFSSQSHFPKDPTKECSGQVMFVQIAMLRSALGHGFISPLVKGVLRGRTVGVLLRDAHSQVCSFACCPHVDDAAQPPIHSFIPFASPTFSVQLFLLMYWCVWNTGVLSSVHTLAF